MPRRLRLSRLVLVVLAFGPSVLAASPASATTHPVFPAPTAWKSVTGVTLPVTGSWCASASSCIVSSWVNSGMSARPVFATLAKGSWSKVVAHVPSDVSGTTQSGPLGFDCATIQSCMGVGGYSTNQVFTSSGYGIAGGAAGWQPAAPVDPPSDTGMDPATLVAVACPSVTKCLAVGEYDTSGAVQGVYFSTWSPSGWSRAVAIPAPTDRSMMFGSYYPSSISCLSVSSCIAIGTYNSTGGSSVPWVATYSSGAFSRAVPAPLPASFNGIGYLDQISCRTGFGCLATGGGTNSSAVQQDFVIPFNKYGNMVNVATPVALPTGVGASTGEGNAFVSCLSSQIGCVVSLSYASSKMELANFDYDAVQRSTRGVTGPATALADGVSCASDLSCTVFSSTNSPTAQVYYATVQGLS